jgi:undecaprenyl-phosphate 4-deoxy-4-formamido-L-arabinose transferase
MCRWSSRFITKKTIWRSSAIGCWHALETLGRPFEIIFVDDGSSDRSWEILRDLHRRHPDRIRAIQFFRNFGQHQAIFAGFQVTRGRSSSPWTRTCRTRRKTSPSWWPRSRKATTPWAAGGKTAGIPGCGDCPPFFINRLMSWVTGVKLRDYGCMLRAYRREVVDSINRCQESSSFIPALANLYARRVTEIPVGHAERGSGASPNTTCSSSCALTST